MLAAGVGENLVYGKFVGNDELLVTALQFLGHYCRRATQPARLLPRHADTLGPEPEQESLFSRR
jgi:hypothetical protein